ncbi:MAG: LamG-like jellyroll fold domain-containing protein [Rhodothermales bacterium]
MPGLLLLAVLALPRIASAQLTSLTASEGLFEDRVVLNWTGTVPAGESIKIRRVNLGTSTDEGVIAVRARTETEFVDRTVLRGESYEYHVYYQDGGAEVVAYGHSKVFAPANVTATYDTREDGVLVTWSDRSDVEARFVITRNASYYDTTAANTGLYLDTGAVSGQQYTYCVIADDGNFVLSANSCAIGRRAVVAPPGPVTASDGQYNNFVRVTFADQSANEDEFRIYTVDGGGNPTLVGTIPGDATTDDETFDDTGAAFGVTNSYCVAAVVGAQESKLICDNGVRGLLASPTNVVATYDDYDDRIAITWENTSEIPDGFKVRRTSVSDDLWLGSAGPAARAFTDKTAKQEIEYTYCVTAFSIVDADSTFSDPACSAPGRRTTVLPPTDVAATDGAYEDRAGLTWTDGSTTAMLFNVYRDGVLVDNVAPSTPFFVDDEGPANVVVDYCVTAVSVTNGAFSAQQSVQMLKDAKLAAVGSVAANGTETVAARTFEYYRDAVAATGSPQEAMGVVETAMVCDPGSRKLSAPTQLSASYDEYEDRVQLSWTDNSSAEAGYVVRRLGAPGSVLSFDGATSEVTAHATTVPTLTDYTIEAWIRQDGGSGATATNKKFVVMFDNLAYAVDLSIASQSGEWGRVHVQDVYWTTPLTDFSSNRSDLDDNEWHHIVLVRDWAASTLSLYIDGTLDQTVSYTPTAAAVLEPRFVFFGRFDAGTYYDGLLSGVKVFDEPKSASQVSDRFENGDAGGTSGLAYDWPLDDGSGTTAIDRGPHAQNGTVSGATWVAAGASLFSTLAVVDTVSAGRQNLGDFAGVPGSEYRYYVTAYDERGIGGESAAGTDVGYRSLNPPTAVQATDGTSETEVEVTWTDNSRVETGYEILRDGTVIGSVARNVTSFTDTGSTLGVVHSYSVRATDNFGVSEEDSDDGNTAILPPGNVNASEQYADKVVVSWNDDSGIEALYWVTRDGVSLASLAANTTTYTDSTPPGAGPFTYCIETAGVNDMRASSCDEGRLAVSTTNLTSSVVGVSELIRADNSVAGQQFNFGSYVAVDGNKAIVVGGNANVHSTPFVFSNGSWQRLPLLESASSGYATTAEISGDVAIVKWSNPSKVALLRFIDGAWSSTQDFVTVGVASVDIEGSRAAAGETDYAGGAGILQGRIRMYDRAASGTWAETFVLPNSPVAGEQIGRSVAVSGDYLAAATNASRVVLFRFDGAAWNEIQVLTATDCGTCTDIAMDGPYLVVSDNTDASVNAYVFERTTSTQWTKTASLTGSNGVYNESRVDISGNRILVGSLGGFAIPGAAWIFVRTGSSWSEASALLPASADGTPISSANDLFGASVSISKDFAFVGAPLFDPGNDGAVFIQPLVGSPSNIAVSDGTFDDRIQLTWNDIVANEELFNVYRREGDDTLLVGTTSKDGEFFDDFSAMPGGTYEYCVTGSNSEILSAAPALGVSSPVCDTGWRPANGTISGQISALASGSSAAEAPQTQLDVEAVQSFSSADTSAISFSGAASGDGGATTSVSAADNSVNVCITPNPNKALQFDGVGGYVSVPYVPATTQRTACTWIKTTADGGGYSLINWGSVEAGTYAFLQLFNGVLYYGEVGSGFNQVWTPFAVNTGQWVHVCVVKDGNTATLYVDGQPTASSSGFTFPVTTDLLTIGAARQGETVDAFYKGEMDDVQLWDVALSQSGIEAVRAGTTTGSEGAVAAYWPFNQASGSVVADVSASVAHGRLINGVFWVDGPNIGECVRSDQNGNYTFGGLRYGEKATFTVRPEEPARSFTPVQKDITLSVQSPVENQVDFTDNTQLGVSGLVQFAGTSCPAPDVQIQVDGENRASTQSDGTFSLSLFPSSGPTALYRIRPSVTSPDPSDITVFSPKYQDLLVDDDLFDINFVSLKTRTLRGYYGGSCAAAGNLGSATLRVFTEDGCFDQTYPISGNFEIELPPQAYLVQVVGVNNAPAGLEADMIRFFDDLGARESDLSLTDDTLDFIFRPDLIIDIAGLPTPASSCSSGLIAADRTLPNVPVIGRAQPVDLSISVREDYGNGNFCPVTSGSVEIFDAIADKGGKAQEFSLDSTNGVIDYTTIGASPNTSQGAFVSGVDRSFQKSITAVANVVGKSPVRATEWALVEGLRPRTAEFVSATTEPFPILLLRDPPGGNSMAYIEKGVTNCQSLTNMHVAGGGAGAEVNLALGLTTTLGSNLFGVTLSFGSSGVALAVRTDIESGRHNGSGGAIEVCATTTERWSTSDDPAWTGEDLYMGVALNLLFARADELKVDDPSCSVNLDEVLAADINPDDAFETTYVYGTTHIATSLIPALEDLIALAGDPTLSGDPNSDGIEDSVSLTNALANWKAQLAAEDSLATEALKDPANVKNISFSSGADYEFGTTIDSTRTWTETTRIYIKDASTLGVIVWAAGVEQDFFAKFNVESEWTRDSTWTSGESRAMGYVLSDGDTGDFFSVDVGEDPRYGTPVFGIVSGRSSNPWEQGPGAVRNDGTRCGGDGDPCTQRRDWPEISVNPPVQRDVDPNGTATFEVTLTNKSENNERRQYALAVPGELNPRNLAIKATGGPLGGTRRETFTLEGGESRTINVDVSRISPTYSYENVGLMLYPENDYAIWQGDPRTPFATSDTAFISVYFDAPCSEIAILRPESPWYYGGGSSPLQVILDGIDSDVGPSDSLVAVGMDYRLKGQPNWLPALDTAMVDLGLDATSWTTFWIPPQDGEYELRARTECVSTAAGADPPKVYSPIAEGVVDTKAPLVFGTPEPADQILTLGRDIAITFDEPILCKSIVTNGVGTNTTLSYASGPDQGTAITGLLKACDSRKVILAPPSSFDWAAAEGLVLEAFMDGVTDLSGNPLAAPATWMFTVKRSAFTWAPANVDVDITRGTGTVVTSKLVNGRAQDALFEIPPTFKLGSAAGDTAIVSPTLTSGTVVPGGTATVSFEVPDTLALGTYTATVNATRIESGFAQEIIPFYVTANVVCAAPAVWEVNPPSFEYSMTLTARLNISGVNSTDGNDRVVAMVGNEVRGVANVDNGLVSMVIYSNTLVGETIRFEVWDDSDCVLYDETTKSIVFENNTTQGTVSQPAIIGAPYVADPNAVNLAAGWTWISLNKTPVDPSVDAVLADIVASPGDLVKTSGQFSIYDEQFGWVGTLADINPGPGYQVYVQQSGGFVPGGTIVDLGTNPISVSPGWNWIGYLPQAAQPVGDALSSLTPVNGDVIKSQFGFAQFDTGTWYGSLTDMQPGVGYQLNVANAGTLTYSEPTNVMASADLTRFPESGGTPAGSSKKFGPNADESRLAEPAASSQTSKAVPAPGKSLPEGSYLEPEAASSASAEGESFDARKFESTMTVTAAVTFDGEPLLGNDGYVWVVDEKGKERGHGRVRRVAAGKGFRLFLMVYGNKDDNSALIVRGRNPETGKVVEVTNQLQFASGVQVGTIEEPLALDLSEAWSMEAETTVEPLPEEFVLLPNYPNPFREKTVIHYELPNDATVRLTVYDLLGREVLRLVDDEKKAGRYDVDFDASHLASGVYLYRIKAGDYTQVHKMTLVK